MSNVTTTIAAIDDSKKLTQGQVNYINAINSAVVKFTDTSAYFHGAVKDGVTFGELSNAEQGLLLTQVDATATAAADKATATKGNVQNHLGRAFMEAGYTAAMCTADSGMDYQNLKTLVHLGLSKDIQELAAMPPASKCTPTQVARMELLQSKKRTDMKRASATGKAANIVGKISKQLARMETAAAEIASGLRGDDGKLVEGVALPTDHAAHNAVKLEKALNAAHKRALDCSADDLCHLRCNPEEVAAAIAAVIQMMQPSSIVDDTGITGADVIASQAEVNAGNTAGIQ